MIQRKGKEKWCNVKEKMKRNQNIIEMKMEILL